MTRGAPKTPGSRAVRLVAAALAAAAACGPDQGYHGCRSTNARVCDAALSRVCSCETADCSDTTAQPVVLELRRCAETGVESDIVDLGLCIWRAEAYCVYFDAVARRSTAICGRPCDEAFACDVRQWCTELQGAVCAADAGQP